MQSEQLQEAARASFEYAHAIAEDCGAEAKGEAPPPVHLLPETATMAQACGSTRLVLRGHNAAVVKVRPAPFCTPRHLGALIHSETSRAFCRP